MPKRLTLILILGLLTSQAWGTSPKEVALSFDDAPVASSLHFNSVQRTRKLVRSLRKQNVSSVMVFANPCKNSNIDNMMRRLKIYKKAGHYIGNHTCNHPRLDKFGFEAFTKDVEKADRLLQPLFPKQKFLRFPYLNEGNKPELRDKMRTWLAQNSYRNAPITGDNEDPTFSKKINDAKQLGKKIDYAAVKRLFVDHIISSLECNNKLAIETIGRSPRHMLLLHEADATVMFIEDLITELRRRNWKIIDPIEAYEDPLYKIKPRNTYSGFGLIAQVAYEKTNKKKRCYNYKKMVKNLNQILGL